ncbi:MAG: hypothetical protein D4R39_04255 [Methylophilaceae bacterium]|nr:MAG: hypothetical protein D4R39_04255 [Methylophilaceae bacterium]
MGALDAAMDAKIAAAAKAAPVTSSPIVDEQTKIQGARDAIAAAPKPLTNTQILANAQAAATAARAAEIAANPLLNKAVVPTDAPAGQHYTWIGGTTTGSWKLYKDIVIPGYTPPPAGGDDYTTVGGILNFKGSPFTGSYNGSNYVNGKITTAGKSGSGVYTGSGTDADPFSLDGKPFNGSLGGSNYVNGVLVKTGGNTPVVIPPGGSVNANPGALQIITDALKAAGLGSLSASAWAMWNKGFDFNAIMDDPIQGIRASAEYKKVFPAMAELNAMGEGITEGQYLDKVATDKELLKQYNIPSGIFDTAEYLGSLMINHVNAVELQKRLIAAQDSVMSLDPNVRKYGKDVFGLDDGHLMLFALDPKMALPKIQEQAKAIQIGGAAFAAGLAAQDITKTEAESLAAAGVTQDQARQGFVNVAQMGQYKQALPGANPAETVTNEDLINAQFATSPDAIMKFQKAKQSKLSEFAQGGQFAATQAGVVGLGNAPVI